MLQWEKGRDKTIYFNNNKDIIVLEPKVTYEYDERGREIKDVTYTKRNITREINETAKLLKTETLQQKAEQIGKLLGR